MREHRGGPPRPGGGWANGTRSRIRFRDAGPEPDLKPVRRAGPFSRPFPLRAPPVAVRQRDNLGQPAEQLASHWVRAVTDRPVEAGAGPTGSDLVDDGAGVRHGTTEADVRVVDLGDSLD